MCPQLSRGLARSHEWDLDRPGGCWGDFVQAQKCRNYSGWWKQHGISARGCLGSRSSEAVPLGFLLSLFNVAVPKAPLGSGWHAAAKVDVRFIITIIIIFSAAWGLWLLASRFQQGLPTRRQQVQPLSLLVIPWPPCCNWVQNRPAQMLR